MDQRAKDRTVKWVIIIVAILVTLALIGFWSEGFGLYGVEQAPSADPNPAASTNR